MSELCPIDVSGYKARPATFDAFPSLAWVAIDKLVIDRSYQRGITPAGKRAIKRIAEGFDWKKFSPILIAPREGGVFAIIDGQHRAHAAAICGLAEVPGMIMEMTLAEQARGFAAVNRDRVAVDSLAVFKAELAAGAGWARGCEEVVRAAGCTIARSNASTLLKPPRVIYAIGLIRKMVRAGLGEVVTVGLRGISESSLGDERDSYAGPILAVWFAALESNQRFLRLDLAAAFDAIDVWEVCDVAKRKARGSSESGRAIATRVLQDKLRERLT